MKRFFSPFGSSNKWSKIFATSHMLGWITTMVNTYLIIDQVQKAKQELLKVSEDNKTLE